MYLSRYYGLEEVSDYCEQVKKKALLRRLITTTQKIEQSAYAQPDDVDSAIDQAQQSLFELNQGGKNKLGTTLKDFI